jgi:hypothetical protein
MSPHRIWQFACFEGEGMPGLQRASQAVAESVAFYGLSGLKPCLFIASDGSAYLEGELDA